MFLVPKCLSVGYLCVYQFNPYTAGGYFDQYKMMQQSWKTTETQGNGYSSESAQWELSNVYQHNRV